MTASPGAEGLENRASVIITPDQRVRVFISSTLEELAEERAAALRAIRRLHLVPVWYESGARPHPPQQHVPGLSGAEPDFCGHLLAAVWLGGAGHGDLRSGG